MRHFAAKALLACIDRDSLTLAPLTFSPKFWKDAAGPIQRFGVNEKKIRQSINSIEEIRKGVRLIATLISFWYEGNTASYAAKLRSL
jgi:hypothetical protein